jgi:hypothetical protein
MTDLFKIERKTLRPKWAYEIPGKGVKKINRKICRKRLKRQMPDLVAGCD